MGKLDGIGQEVGKDATQSFFINVHDQTLDIFFKNKPDAFACANARPDPVYRGF